MTSVSVFFFGSENIENANEMSVSNILETPSELKRDIVAFDWWIRNGDRTLTEAGGNPNILWSETSRQLFVIDHNLCFDEGVTLHSQLTTHIFRSALTEICDTPDLQAHYKTKFDMLLPGLPQILRDIPHRWHYVDEACTIESALSIANVEAILQRHRVPAFWERT